MNQGTAPSDFEQRILILACFGRDAALIAGALRKHSLSCMACRDFQELTEEFERGAGIIILTEESLPHSDQLVTNMFMRQAQWSDVPFLLLTRQGVDSAVVHTAIANLHNVTLHERPLRATELVSAVRGALRSRNRQYQIRAYLQEREEANKRKDEFLATLAHELRNPLAPIRNSIHLLRSATDNAKVIDMVERQVNHIVRLVDDLMEISRITQGKIELNKEKLNLATVIDSAIETSLPLIEEGNHILVRPHFHSAVIVEGDHTRLAQVISNLLNNATKYSDPGSRISIELNVSNSMAIITIEDTGIGISRGSLEEIFEMFRQGSLPHDRVSSGLGIGLSLSRKLVEMHGGILLAESEGEGKGSRFTVRLPILHIGNPEIAPSKSKALIALNSQRILVVDDNRDAAESLGELLRLMGANVAVAFDGPTALKCVAQFSPQVVLLDLGMPGMDGYEVASRIRQNVENKGISLVALTGWGQEDDRARTRTAGFSHHLVKPVDVDTVQQVLASL